MDDTPLAPPHRWKHDAGPPVPSRRGPALALLACVLALAGAVAAWLLYPRAFAAPYFLGLWVDQYGDPRLPGNSWAAQDRAALRAVWPQAREGFPSQTRALFVEELRDLSRRPARDTVVVFLSATALPRPADGRVALLLADSRLDDPGTWLPVAEVLSRLRECPARRKLLVLDVMRPFADARAGVLADEVAARLGPDLDEVLAADPHLSVLTACSPGQVSLAPEELGHTLFAHVLVRGLRGGADPTGNGRVALRELAGYVTREVDRWAWANVRQRQTPRLLGQTTDFDLAVVDRTAAEDEPAPSPVGAEYLGWLRGAWEKRDAWWKDGSYESVVEEFGDLEESLLRAERRWRGGADPVRLREELSRRLASLERELRQGLPVGPPRSLASALARLPEPPPASPEVRRQLARLAARVKAAPPAAQGSAPAKPDPELTDFLKPYEGKPLVLAGTLFTAAATEEEPGRDYLVFLAGLLPADAADTFPESRWLRRLAAPPGPPAPGPARAAGCALRAVDRAERTAAGSPRARRWVAGRVRAAAGRLAEGEELLFSTDVAQRAAAEGKLREAAVGFERAHHDLETVRRAQRARDEARVLLPGCAAYLAAAERDEAALATLERSVAVVRRLRDLLAVPPADGVTDDAVLRELNDLAGALTDPHYLPRLCRAAEPDAFARLIGRSRTGGPADATAMRAVLELRALDAGRRAALWKAWRGLSARLHEEFAETADAPALPAWGDAEQERAARVERERGLWRARVALGLAPLQTSRPPGEVDRLRQRVAELQQLPDVPLGALGRELSALLAGH